MVENGGKNEIIRRIMIELFWESSCAAGASTKTVQQAMLQNINSTATNLTTQGASQGTVNAATNSITNGMGKAGANTVNSMTKVEATAAVATETTTKVVDTQLKKK